MFVSARKTAVVYQRLFFRIGTFQRVTSDANKEILLTSQLAPRVVVELGFYSGGLFLVAG